MAASVLVVDHDELPRQHCDETLQRLGCEVKAADGGLRTLELLEQNQVDVLVADVRERGKALLIFPRLFTSGYPVWT